MRFGPCSPRRVLMFGMLVLALGLTGCDGQPRAPGLKKGDAEYHNPTLGICFTPPSGWGQFGNVGLSADMLAKEELLVKYRLVENRRSALLRVTVADLPATTSLEQYLREKPPGPEDWRPMSPKCEPVEVNGRAGIRLTFTGSWDGQDAVKEVVAVRRGGRVWFFTGIFGAGDSKAREAIRRAVTGVVWEDKS